MKGIYTITNIINNKIYIGSSNNISSRLIHHKQSLKNNKHNNPYLQKAFNKYGIKNFKFEILEECQEELLLYIEQYWINILNTLNVNFGYNIKQPISNIYNHLTKEIDQYDLNGEFIKSWNSIKEAGKELNICTSTISKVCLNKNNNIKNFIFRYKGISLGNFKSKRGKKVIQYTLNNNQVKIWNSTAEIGRSFKCDPSSIANCCQGKSKTSFNYKWKYYEGN